MREVLDCELGTFRKMAVKIYDTMTQDVSDVLTNEHVQLIEFQNEKVALYNQKMMRAIDTILECAKNFDFEAYHENPDAYLKRLFPLVSFVRYNSLSENSNFFLLPTLVFRVIWIRINKTSY